MKHLLLPLLIGLPLLPLHAQNQASVQLAETVNAHVSGIKNGYFDLTYEWKSMTKEDTTKGEARTYFFREKADVDSMAQVIVCRNGQLWEAYDGKNFYVGNQGSKKIRVSPKEERLESRNKWGTYSYFPFITALGRPALRKFRFERSILEIVQLQDQKMAVVTVRDSMPNSLKQKETDPAMMQHKLVYTIRLSDSTLVDVKEEFKSFVLSPQYERHALGDMVALPDSLDFESMLSQLTAGYTIEMLLDKSLSDASKNFPGLAAGDTLVPFNFQGMNDQNYVSSALPNQLVLLDFWYRGCAPCIMAMPFIKKIHAQYKDKGLLILGVNVQDKDVEILKKFAKDREVEYPIVLDSEKKYAKQLRLKGYPTIALLDLHAQKIVYVQSGFSQEDKYSELEKLLDTLLK